MSAHAMLHPMRYALFHPMHQISSATYHKHSWFCHCISNRVNTQYVTLSQFMPHVRLCQQPHWVAPQLVSPGAIDAILRLLILNHIL